jgi:glycosyltransferase involved in cell wall biosynthesis
MKILLVSSRYPLPPWRGNQLRTLQWLDALDDHERLLVCPTGDAGSPKLPPGVRFAGLPGGGFGAAGGLVAAFFQGRPAQEGIYATVGARRRLTEILQEFRPDLAVIQMVRSGWAADEISKRRPETPILFDAIDCMGLHYGRAAALCSPPLSMAYGFEGGRCRRRETELVGRADLSTAVSGRDLEALGTGPRGMVVPVTGGVEPECARAENDSPTVLLSGNLGYRPTVRAALWFADRIWRKVQKSVPSARFILAGARPVPDVRRLAAIPGVEVHADVDDLSVFLNRATVAIAPMAGGSGVPIKILEAMAAGVPVIADPWSASGLEDATGVVVAEDEIEWLEEVRRLLTDREASREQAVRGVEVWRAHYHPDRVSAQIRRAVERAVAGSV